jgi:hypothetical protein
MSKYLPLGEYLRSLGVSRVQLSFEEVTRLVGGLPPSASQYRAWWANEPRTHSHARAWLEAGWRVDAVNLGRWVSFARVSAPPRPSVAAPPLVIRPPAARLQGVSHPRESTLVSNSLTAGSADTLLVLPCSSRKRSGGTRALEGRTLVEDLPAELADRLRAARARNAAEASVDETLLLPAFRRYAGTLYEAAGDSIQQAIRAGWHILILSGGYGQSETTTPASSPTAGRAMSSRTPWSPTPVGTALLRPSSSLEGPRPTRRWHVEQRGSEAAWMLSCSALRSLAVVPW